MTERINIIGCGGHARSIADVVKCNWPDRLITFYDENARPSETIFRGGTQYAL